MFRKRKERKLKTNKKQIVKIRKNARKLKSMSRMKIPNGIKKEEIQEIKAYKKWLLESSEQLFNLTNKWIKRDPDDDEFFNNQLLNLQQAMQKEMRQFTMISNIMKTKHDTAKSYINNIR